MSAAVESIAVASFREAMALLQALPLPRPETAPPLELRTSGWADARRDVADGPPLAVPASERSPLPATLTDAPSLAAAARDIRTGSLTARELVEQSLAAAYDAESLGAVVAHDPVAALEAADVLDAEARSGRFRGPLHGIPVTVKDVIHAAGFPTRAGSLSYDEMPSADAASVALVRQAGAVVLAKVATHEFALGVATPQCHNPYDATRIPGGSSGGSAIAVAMGIGLASIGTDTRASLRVPAALSGVVGFKPSYGLVPTGGIVPLSWTVDQIGPIARTVEDATLVLSVLANDPSLADVVPSCEGLTVGVMPTALEGTEPAVAAAFEATLLVLESLGCRLVRLETPNAADLEEANALGLLISRCEAAAFHRSRCTDLSVLIPEVRDQLTFALEVPAIDYLDAQRHREILARRVGQAFTSCDIVATPTTPVVAPFRDDYERYLLLLSQNLIIWSLVGVPAVSIPCGTSPAGLPIGIQLAARAGGEATLAAAGIALERALLT